jgi:hypothetical protein
MRSILIILFAVLIVNSTQAQEGEPKEKNFLQAISFKHNEVFKRFGVFTSANVLYYHSNLGIGFDCFLVKNFSINIEAAVGNSYGLDYLDESFDKLWNMKASIGLKCWPITKKTNNCIYPFIGVNLAYTSVHLVSESILGSSVIETPVGLCYYKDGFQFSSQVGAFIDWGPGFTPLAPREIYPFISFQVGYRF